MNSTTHSRAEYHTADGQSLYELAKSIIPGGTQLLSKRPEMFAPEQWPPYFKEAHGCEVVDLDGRHYCDMSTMGIGACLLGYNDPNVSDAVTARVRAGSMCSLNCPEEVELAQLLLGLHPWAKNVRFGRCGGEAMAIAVRIARASTNRDVIAFCGYHGWHDWYLAANHTVQPGGDALGSHLLPGLSPNGVPTQLAGTALPFGYNQIDSLVRIVEQEGTCLAAVVLEPTRSVDPAPGFLEGVRELCDRSGAVMILDEISIGWRLTLGGAHLKFGVTPDIAVFAKAMGNGHPIAAIVGRREVMQAAQDSFISSTYWTEGVGTVAALATIRRMRQTDVATHIAVIGTQFREGLKSIAAANAVPMRLSGYPAMTYLAFDHPEDLALQTLLTVRMLQLGFLTGSAFYPSLAHTPECVDRYLAAAEEVFSELGDAIRDNDISTRIDGPRRHSGFARLA